MFQSWHYLYVTDLPALMLFINLRAVFVPKEYGGNPPDDMDAFFELIMIDEVARVGGGGVLGQVTT
jgi:hypothetical protein